MKAQAISSDMLIQGITGVDKEMCNIMRRSLNVFAISLNFASALETGIIANSLLHYSHNLRYPGF